MPRCPRRHASLLVALLALLLIAPVGAGEAGSWDPTRRLDLGRRLSALLLAGQLDELRQRFTRQMEQRMTAARLETLSDEAARRLGAEVALVDENVEAANAGWRYTRVTRHERYPGTVTQRWLLDARGQVLDVALEPRPEPAPSPYVHRRPNVRLGLPFSGEWHVTWGGRAIEDNYHVVNANQRFAYDFDVRRDGRTHRGDGRALEDYYAFGRPILAAAGGVVVVAVDGVPDNPPSRPNGERPAGNHVVIDHGGGEHSVYLHLQQGSLEVEAGDVVRRGRWLGRCGNSGSSAVPHLHFHLQNAPRFGRGSSLPAPFVDYVADGVEVPLGEPARGQNVLGLGRVSWPAHR